MSHDFDFVYTFPALYWKRVQNRWVGASRHIIYLPRNPNLRCCAPGSVTLAAREQFGDSYKCCLCRLFSTPTIYSDPFDFPVVDGFSIRTSCLLLSHVDWLVILHAYTLKFKHDRARHVVPSHQRSGTTVATFQVETRRSMGAQVRPKLTATPEYMVGN